MLFSRRHIFNLRNSWSRLLMVLLSPSSIYAGTIHRLGHNHLFHKDGTAGNIRVSIQLLYRVLNMFITNTSGNAHLFLSERMPWNANAVIWLDAMNSHSSRCLWFRTHGTLCITDKLTRPVGYAKSLRTSNSVFTPICNTLACADLTVLALLLTVLRLRTRETSFESNCLSSNKCSLFTALSSFRFAE
jgi:hypothetical protein